jgi:glutaredoxin 3
VIAYFQALQEQSNTAEGAARVAVELYMIQSCPYCAAAREDLEWRGVAYVEYDVEQDRDAYARMLQLTGGNRSVPVIVEEGKPVHIGWGGRGCFI